MTVHHYLLLEPLVVVTIALTSMHGICYNFATLIFFTASLAVA